MPAAEGDVEHFKLPIDFEKLEKESVKNLKNK